MREKDAHLSPSASVGDKPPQFGTIGVAEAAAIPRRPMAENRIHFSDDRFARESLYEGQIVGMALLLEFVESVEIRGIAKADASSHLVRARFRVNDKMLCFSRSQRHDPCHSRLTRCSGRASNQAVTIRLSGNGAQLGNRGGSIRLLDSVDKLVHAVTYTEADAVSAPRCGFHPQHRAVLPGEFRSNGARRDSSL
jgi:hypothetical protein